MRAVTVIWGRIRIPFHVNNIRRLPKCPNQLQCSWTKLNHVGLGCGAARAVTAPPPPWGNSNSNHSHYGSNLAPTLGSLCLVACTHHVRILLIGKSDWNH